MVLSEKIEELHQISQSIIRHQNIRIIGYFLIPIIIGLIIVFFMNKKLKQLADRRQILVKEIEYDTTITFNQLSEWQRSISESNTYLVYHKKADYLNKCDIFLKKHSINRVFCMNRASIRSGNTFSGKRLLMLKIGKKIGRKKHATVFKFSQVVYILYARYKASKM